MDQSGSVIQTRTIVLGGQTGDCDYVSVYDLEVFGIEKGEIIVVTRSSSDVVTYARSSVRRTWASACPVGDCTVSIA